MVIIPLIFLVSVSFACWGLITITAVSFFVSKFNDGQDTPKIQSLMTPEYVKRQTIETRKQFLGAFLLFLIFCFLF